MSFHQFIAIGISLIAVVLSIHTKYKQRGKDRLRELATKLKNLKANTEWIGQTLENPRSHEDLELRLYELPREMLDCQYETGEKEVTVLPEIKTSYGEDSKELSDPQNVFDRYKEDEWFVIQLKVGNLKEMYASDRKFSITDPFWGASDIYTEINEINEQFGGVIGEFNESLLVNLESHLDSMVRKHCDHIIKHTSGFSVNIDEYDSTEAIGRDVFRELYFYDGVKDDLEELEDQLEELENVRTTVLQTSYT